MQTRPSLTAVQDRYIARLHSCRTGHFRRVAHGARKEAEATLTRMGYSASDADQIIRDARDMFVLERDAA